MIVGYPSPESGILVFWRNERTGVLAKTVYAFVEQQEMNSEMLETLRQYFEHWANYPHWKVPETLEEEIQNLRKSIICAHTRQDLDDWLDDALELGIDPL